MERQILHGLQADSYEHPFDHSALNALKGTPGLETLVRKVNEWGLEHFFKVQYTGSNLKVTPDNFPEVYGMVREAGTILNLPLFPDLYIQNEVGINALTTGVERPVVVLNASCIDCLSPDELFFVIGHELGHVKSGHVLYLQIGDLLPVLGEIADHITFGFGGIFSTAIEVALLNWQRMAELTADRAGLLACQNRDASISAMIKMAGLPQKFYNRFNVEDFIAQAREFKALDQHPLDKVAKILSIMGQSHPWTVLRAAEFDSWTTSGEYNRILEACGIQTKSSETDSSFCPVCGSSLTGGESFCPTCGHNLVGVAASVS
jgi:Zn-dependent protease with chaperone function